MELKVPEAPQGQQVRLPTNGKLQHGDSKSSFSLDIAGEADDHVNIRVADWNSHVSILHPCGRLEWPCFHIISVWLTGAAMFPYYIRVADWSGHVSILYPCGQLEWPCLPCLSREGQCVSNESPVHQTQRYSMCGDLIVCRVRLGLGYASLMNQSPNASWTDTYPKFDVGRLTFPSF